jgi:hypothetical protein
MRTLALALALVVVPALGRAETNVDIHIGLPAVLPRLVVVSPGVQVVPEVDEEVFFTDGYYWVRRDSVWYRSRVHTGGWVVVPGRAVPGRLVKIPPGHYKHWKPAKAEKAYRGEPGGGHGGGGKFKGGKGKH